MMRGFGVLGIIIYYENWWENIEIIIENSQVPVIIDAGIGVPSHAAEAMEMGADAVLINSAIALAKNPPLMAEAMGKAVQAGRQAFLAGRLPQRSNAEASSPSVGSIFNKND